MTTADGRAGTLIEAVGVTALRGAGHGDAAVPAALAVLRANGDVELVDAEPIHGNVHRAVFAQLAHTQ